jgi:YVTN family beta-propeller protein
LVLDVTSGAVTEAQANPARSGGSSGLAVFGSTAYVANQTGGSVSALPISASGVPGVPVIIKVDLGPRALAIDTQDNLLLVTNEGSGTVVLIDLWTNKVTGRIDAVRTNGEENDDHGDRDQGHHSSAPSVTSLAPASGHPNSAFTLSITGVNLTGATAVDFLLPKGEGHHQNVQDEKGGSSGSLDTAFSASDIQVNGDGTQLTAAITVAGAAPGAHTLRVTTPAGQSSTRSSTGNTFTVVP